MTLNMNKVSFVEGDSVFVIAENDRIAIKIVDEFLQQNRYKDFATTGTVKCLKYPSYEVRIYNFNKKDE